MQRLGLAAAPAIGAHAEQTITIAILKAGLLLTTFRD